MQRILIYRIGQLGDTIVALPAMWVIRRHFPKAAITLLCDRHARQSYILAPDLLQGTPLADQFEFYEVDDQASRVARYSRMARLLWKLRRQAFDAVLYLAPSARTPPQIRRDKAFFSAAGIKRFIGFNGFPDLPRKIDGQPLGATPAESDLLLARLAADGISVPKPARGSLDLCLAGDEEQAVGEWLARLGDDGGRKWVAIGPGSKMPAKRWPPARFQEVVARLIQEFDVWPVVFGGPEDKAIGLEFVAGWGRGFNAAGALGLRPAAAALQRCAFYLGNDTGTMHLAASSGRPCVALFSAREWPGMWSPYGVDCSILRSQIECEGCSLATCSERKNECLNRIGVPEVLLACSKILANASTKESALATGSPPS